MDNQSLLANKRIIGASLLVLLLLAVFLFAKSLVSFKEYKFVGRDALMMNTISVSGMGEAFAIPDVAEFSFSAIEQADTVEAAQQAATEKVSAATDFLKGEGIADTDIQTTGYNIQPRYEYITETCVPGVPCRPGQQVQDGFEVIHTTNVKVRNTDRAGELLSGIGSLGLQNISGLSFTVDDDEVVKSEARAKAIANAKEKAQTIADNLGVKLGRVMNYSEDYVGTPVPYAYGRGGDMAMQEAAPAPNIQTGENSYTSNVHVMYELR